MIFLSVVCTLGKQVGQCNLTHVSSPKVLLRLSRAMYFWAYSRASSGSRRSKQVGYGIQRDDVDAFPVEAWEGAKILQ